MTSDPCLTEIPVKLDVALVYQDAPNVFVSANHSSTGKNLDPMHNSITAWVEVRNLVCLCNILFAEFQFTELCICVNTGHEVPGRFSLEHRHHWCWGQSSEKHPRHLLSCCVCSRCHQIIQPRPSSRWVAGRKQSKVKEFSLRVSPAKSLLWLMIITVIEKIGTVFLMTSFGLGCLRAECWRLVSNPVTYATNWMHH